MFRTYAAFFTVMLIALTQADAISLRFKSKIFSSGPDIYACNAGVASAFLQNSVCFFRGTNTYCTPTSCDNAKENCNTNCLCLDKGGQGDSYVNKLLLKYKAYNASGNATIPVTKSAIGPRFEPVFSAVDSWNREISDVATHFMTEAYTGSYFIDICYRGTQIPNGGGYFVLSTEASAIPFLVTDLLGYGSFDNNRNGLDFNVVGQLYTEKAGLTVERFVVCGTSANTSDFAINGTTGVPSGPVSGATFYSASPEASLRASAQTVAHGSTIDPKFCKVRYIFRETNWRASVPAKRDNLGEGAEVCTYTKISDPVAQ
ncbi:MAG: hypothetical protein JNL11_02575 [Bdellovibrionaceae bacterium]|nr:hypothetical protein [Pseudobdellovibrionaceae bacterium]